MSGGMGGVGAGAAADAAAATAANLAAAAAEDDIVEGTGGIPPALDNGCISETRDSADKIAFSWGIAINIKITSEVASQVLELGL